MTKETKQQCKPRDRFGERLAEDARIILERAMDMSPEMAGYQKGIRAVMTMLQSDSYFSLAVRQAGRRKMYQRDYRLLNQYRKIIQAEAGMLF